MKTNSLEYLLKLTFLVFSHSSLVSLCSRSFSGGASNLMTSLDSNNLKKIFTTNAQTILNRKPFLCIHTIYIMTHFIDNIILKTYTEAEQDSFVDMFMNEELCQYMAGGAFDQEHDAIKLFNFFLALSAQKNQHKQVFAIFLAKIHIGHFEIDKKEQEIEIVYLLEKKYWGKGIIYKIINYFNQQYDETIFARVMPSNNNSIKLLEKIGIAKKTLSTFNKQKVIKYTLQKNK